MRSTTGFDLSTLERGDDNSSDETSLGFQANFFGSTRSTAFVNNNGNITFDGALSAFTPFSLSSTESEIIAPFFADVDTTNTASGEVTYGQGTIDGRRSFVATWNNVGYFSSRADKLNKFQVILVDRSDVNAGDFDIELNYDQIQWESGEASGGVDGLGGSSARAGFANGSGQEGTFFEIPGSGVNGALLDSNELTALIRQTNVDQPGRFLFRVRNGVISISSPAQIAGEAQEEAISDTASAEVRSVVRTVITAVQSRLQSLRTRNRGFSVQQAAAADGNAGVIGASGVSGSAIAPQIGIWTEGSLTRLSNDTPNNSFSGNSKNLLIGVDYPVLDELVIGIAAGIESLYLDLSDQRSERRSLGGSGTVYAGYLISDWILASAQFGFSRGGQRIEQNSVFFGEVNGDFGSTRLLGGISVSAFTQWEQFEFVGGVGYNRAREWFDSYNDSLGTRIDPPGTGLGQIAFSGEAAYNFSDHGQIFTLARYEWDHRTEPGVDPNGAVLGGGFRYAVMDQLEVSLQGTAQVLRRDDEQFTVTGGMRYSF